MFKSPPQHDGDVKTCKHICTGNAHSVGGMSFRESALQVEREREIAFATRAGDDVMPEVYSRTWDRPPGAWTGGLDDDACASLADGCWGGLFRANMCRHRAGSEDDTRHQYQTYRPTDPVNPCHLLQKRKKEHPSGPSSAGAGAGTPAW